MTTSQNSYGTNFRRAEEASNAQGTVAGALQTAIKNAEKNPTKANLAILAQTSAARAQTTAKQTKEIQDVIAGVPSQISETEKAITEAQAAIEGVNVAGADIPGFQKINAKAEDTSMQDAYQRLYDEFNALGLGNLVEDSKAFLMRATSIAAIPDALRGTTAYKERFSANDARIKAGFRSLSPAEYIRLEDQYQNVMRNYGLPASYYTPCLYGRQEGFEKLIAGDVSNTQLEERIAAGQNRVINANPEVSKALKQFFPEITNGDILAYTLDPEKGIEDIKRKITAAEIGGAAMTPKDSMGRDILTTSKARAEQLAGYGVDKAMATEGYSTIGAGLQRGSELASIYQQDPYTQTTAEEEVFKLSGQTEARKKRQKITGLEKAAFGGQTGLTSGALARDRAGGI